MEPRPIHADFEDYTQLITEAAAECGLNIEDVLLELERENAARHQAIVAIEQERDSLVQTLEEIQRALQEARRDRDALQEHIDTLRQSEANESLLSATAMPPG